MFSIILLSCSNVREKNDFEEINFNKVYDYKAANGKVYPFIIVKNKTDCYLKIFTEIGRPDIIFKLNDIIHNAYIHLTTIVVASYNEIVKYSLDQTGSIINQTSENIQELYFHEYWNNPQPNKAIDPSR